ncbi:MAG: signal peptide peptidase SppA, partial [Solirubrobacteraceae bacterium]
MASTPLLLELDLSQGLLETQPSDPIAAFRSRNTPVLTSLVERLREAAESDRVVGLIAHAGGADGLSHAQVEELGAAIEAFAASGKQTIAWSESFGESGDGTLAYHLAAHFDRIWLQPSGDLGLVGVKAGGVFLREALRKVGVEPQIRARHEYKNAPDSLLRETMGEHQREALQRLTDSLTDGIVTTVARRRGLTAEAVRAAIAAAPLTATEALDHELVDHLGYRDQAYGAARRVAAGAGHETTAEDDLPELELRYVHRWAPPKRQAAAKRVRREVARRTPAALRKPTPDVIAVVPVEGGIGLGRGGGSPFSGPSAGSDVVCAALRQAGGSDQVAAVVLRVVSPGGSYVASDAIHREVVRLRDNGTPVVASMGTVAASGGYFVAMGCDEILALPGTLTGSIGVFAGKVVVGEALRRVGVSRETVATGENATMWSADRPFDEAELARLDGWLDTVYADFTEKAAEGRGMPVDQLEPLARGRVWTGADAHERGLVDRLGGLEEAITIAAEKAGRPRSAVHAVRFPDVSPLQQLRPPASSEAVRARL